MFPSILRFKLGNCALLFEKVMQHFRSLWCSYPLYNSYLLYRGAANAIMTQLAIFLSILRNG